MKPFLSLRGSRAGFFSDLFTGDPCPLRIPFDRVRAAVSPIPKPRKERRPPASRCRNDFMFSPVRRISGQKRHLYTSGLHSCGAKAIIELLFCHCTSTWLRVVSHSTLLMAVSLPNGCSKHLELRILCFEFVYLPP
jgi:hypothetical protein